MTSSLEIAAVAGATAIILLVAIVWYRRRRSRPALEADEAAYQRRRLEVLRNLAASDYSPKRHDANGKAL